MGWARDELDAQIEEIKYGVDSVTAAQDDGAAAVATVKLLEGETLEMRLSPEGVQGGGMLVDSVHTLLLNKSPKFVAAFNKALAQELRRVAAEQGSEPVEDGD
eukprot:scaffold167804_cov33-Tisochrysis_lutea.AAC.2